MPEIASPNSNTTGDGTQSQKRSAGYDIVTNPTNVTVVVS